MAPITTASNDETHQALLDALDMQPVPKPFRNPHWKPPQRRNKNLKQILAEQQRAQQSVLNTQQNSGASTPLASTDGTSTPASLNPNLAQASHDLNRLVLEKNVKQQNAGALGAPSNGTIHIPSVTYTSIAAAPSLKPKKKYCDITGLRTTYTDPKTGLHYFNSEIYQVVKNLTTAQVQEYLALRGANTVLKLYATTNEAFDVRPSLVKPPPPTFPLSRRCSRRRSGLIVIDGLLFAIDGYRKLREGGEQLQPIRVVVEAIE